MRHMAQESIRIGLRLSGALLEGTRDVRDMCGLNDETAAARYLVSRGLEALSNQLRAKRLMDKMEEHYTPQQMLDFMRSRGIVPEGGE